MILWFCCTAEWLVGESGRTVRVPLCHELVKLLDALVAGESLIVPLHNTVNCILQDHGVDHGHALVNKLVISLP